MSDPKQPELDDVSLDALFAEARADASPSDALMARIVADAAAVSAAVAVPEPQAAPQPGVWAQILDAVGGWPSLSGLATATIAGIYIGFSDPTLLETVGLAQTSEVTGDLLFGDDVFFDDASSEEG